MVALMTKKKPRFLRGSTTVTSSASSAETVAAAAKVAADSVPACIDPAADLAAAVAARADEYTDELFAPATGFDPDTWDDIPQYAQGDLIVGKHLGEGSFSDAFEAMVSTTAPEESKTLYALKRLSPDSQSDVEHFLIGLEDLIHETAILAGLDHPNVIKLHGRAASVGIRAEESVAAAFRLGAGYFLLLDRLEDTLEDRVAAWRAAAPESGRAAPPRARLAAPAAVAAALAHLHDRGIVYRDLKPANVGFDARGTPKLFDFGFATALPDGGRLRGMCGTPRYMAPEVGLGLEYDTAADVHAFGVVLWEVCALKTAFAKVRGWAGMTHTVFKEGVRPALARRWPAALKDILCRCWHPEPGKRLAMEEVAVLLKVYMQSAQQENKTGPLPTRFLSKRLRRVTM